MLRMEQTKMKKTYLFRGIIPRRYRIMCAICFVRDLGKYALLSILLGEVHT